MKTLPVILFRASDGNTLRSNTTVRVRDDHIYSLNTDGRRTTEAWSFSLSGTCKVSTKQSSDATCSETTCSGKSETMCDEKSEKASEKSETACDDQLEHFLVACSSALDQSLTDVLIKDNAFNDADKLAIRSFTNLQSILDMHAPETFGGCGDHKYYLRCQLLSVLALEIAQQYYDKIKASYGLVDLDDAVQHYKELIANTCPDIHTVRKSAWDLAVRFASEHTMLSKMTENAHMMLTVSGLSTMVQLARNTKYDKLQVTTSILDAEEQRSLIRQAYATVSKMCEEDPHQTAVLMASIFLLGKRCVQDTMHLEILCCENVSCCVCNKTVCTSEILYNKCKPCGRCKGIICETCETCDCSFYFPAHVCIQTLFKQWDTMQESVKERNACMDAADRLKKQNESLCTKNVSLAKKEVDTRNTIALLQKEKKEMKQDFKREKHEMMQRSHAEWSKCNEERLHREEEVLGKLEACEQERDEARKTSTRLAETNSELQSSIARHRDERDNVLRLHEEDKRHFLRQLESLQTQLKLEKERVAAYHTDLAATHEDEVSQLRAALTQQSVLLEEKAKELETLRQDNDELNKHLKELQETVHAVETKKDTKKDTRSVQTWTVKMNMSEASTSTESPNVDTSSSERLALESRLQRLEDLVAAQNDAHYPSHNPPQNPPQNPMQNPMQPCAPAATLFHPHPYVASSQAMQYSHPSSLQYYPTYHM